MALPTASTMWTGWRHRVPMGSTAELRRHPLLRPRVLAPARLLLPGLRGPHQPDRRLLGRFLLPAAADQPGGREDAARRWLPGQPSAWRSSWQQLRLSPSADSRARPEPVRGRGYSSTDHNVVQIPRSSSTYILPADYFLSAPALLCSYGRCISSVLRACGAVAGCATAPWYRSRPIPSVAGSPMPEQLR